MKFNKFIHLLYVPTVFCNLGCQYCYLGSQTDCPPPEDENKISDTLSFALHKLTEAKVLPFNVSLHGGEVTSLSPRILDSLFKIIENHYLTYLDELHANNFKKASPHIKTNLYNFGSLYDLLHSHKVSISASIDLPLVLHEKYRTTKNGQSTLKRIQNNLTLLSRYPHNSKISATLFSEHLANPEALIRDIWFIHNEIGFDMNNFNFMFGFNSTLNNENLISKGRTPMNQVNESTQVLFYKKLKEEFMGTNLEYGFRRNWFDEFMPSYCTCAENCGERFYLLQSDGNIYSCVRGQGVSAFHYGNIYTDEADAIFNTAKSKIQDVHQKRGFHPDCRTCEYLHLCHTGCPFIKEENESAKSYTCALQKEIYKDNPTSYPPAKNKEHQQYILQSYQFAVHPHLVNGNAKNKKVRLRLPNELNDSKNELLAIINADPVLTNLYSNDCIFLEQDDNVYNLTSQILKVDRTIFHFLDGEPVKIHIKKSFLTSNTKEPLTNSLYLQMLRDTFIVYGDEKRSKQEHVFTYQIFQSFLTESKLKGNEFLEFDLASLLSIHAGFFIENTLNNLFITSDSLRNYHYQKQKLNAFYHIQAINLPFQNIEFYWSKL